MDYYKLCLVLVIVSTASCASVESPSRQKAPKTASFLQDLLVCGVSQDYKCLLDKAENVVEEKKAALLAQADLEVFKATGRSEDENSPSQLSKAINRIISELTDMFKDGLAGFFKSARENDEEDSDDNLKNPAKARDIGEARKKKKKKKLVGLIKLVIIGLVLKAKLTLLLKALSAALQLKFFLVAVAGLILNAARFYLDLKKGHHPQKVIYYEHAQHQHHYDGHDEDWSSGPGGGYWGRSYEVEKEGNAQDLAYAKQKPVDNGQAGGTSWFG